MHPERKRGSEAQHEYKLQADNVGMKHLRGTNGENVQCKFCNTQDGD